MPLCKKCKQFPIIEFLDYMNLSLNCQCQIINRMSVNEFENELLCEKKAKKDESNSDQIIKVSEYTPLEIELSSESSSKPKLELKEKTINSQLDSNDKKENNESLLKKNLKGFNTILNTDLKEIEEINDTISNEEYNELILKKIKRIKIT